MKGDWFHILELDLVWKSELGVSTAALRNKPRPVT